MNRRSFFGAAAGAAVAGPDAARAAAASLSVESDVVDRAQRYALAGRTAPGASIRSRVTPEMAALAREHGCFNLGDMLAETRNTGVPPDFEVLRSVKPMAKIVWALERRRMESARRDTLASRLYSLCKAAGVPMPFPYMPPEERELGFW